MITAKLVDVFALPAFVSAGLAGLPYRRFAAWVGVTAAVRGLVLIGRRIWWPSRLCRPTAEPPDGQQSLADDEEPALQR